MAITVSGPNGVTVDFPDGTDTDTINKVMSANFGSGSAPKQGGDVGILEAMGRAALDTGTFGLGNALQDRTRMEEARRQRPIASFIGDVLGVGGSTVALGPLAAAGRGMQGAGMVAKTARGVSNAVVPQFAAQTTRGIIGEGIKAGAAQGFLHGVGDSLVDDRKTWGHVLPAGIAEGVTGAAAGGVLAPVIHHAARGVGQLIQRGLPGLDDARAIARDPTAAGTKDIVSALDYDGLTPRALADKVYPRAPQGAGLTDDHVRGMVARFAQGEDDAAIAAAYGLAPDVVAGIRQQDEALRGRFDGMNLLEVAKAGELRPPNGQVPTPINPGRLSQESADVVADALIAGEAPGRIAQRLRSLNLTAADIQAIGAQREALDARRAFQSGERMLAQDAMPMRPEVETTTNLNRLSQWAANQEGRGADMAADAFASRKDAMPQNIATDIERAFGSGDRPGDAARLGQRMEMIGDQYEGMLGRTAPLEVPTFNAMDQHPVFRAALDYAAQAQMVRTPGSGLNRWQPSANGTITDAQTLMPRQIIDIHHYLVMNSRDKIGGDPSAAVQARQLKEWFSRQADQMLQGHETLRRNYAQVRLVMEATEMGASLPIAKGGRSHEGMAFFETHIRALRQAEREQRRAEALYNSAVQRYQAGGMQNAPRRTELNRADRVVQDRRDVVDEFRRAWGERIQQSIMETKSENAAGQALGQLLTPESKARIMTVLGREEGANLIARLHNQQLQSKLGNTLYGNSDTNWKLQYSGRMGSAMQAGMAAMQGRIMDAGRHLTEVASQNAGRARADRVNDVMSQQGIDNVRRLIDAMNARNRLRQAADPFTRNPALEKALPGLTRSTTEQGKVNLE